MQIRAREPVEPRRFVVGARVAAVAGLLAGLYAFGALLPFWYLTSPEADSAFFPAAGLTLGVLVLSPRRTWPLWLTIVGVTEIVVDLTHGQTLGMALGFAAANVVEPLVGATALRWAAAAQRRLTLRRSLTAYLGCAVVLGPIAGAVIGATTAIVIGGASGWLSIAAKWWLGDAIGVLVVATPMLAWSRRSPFDAQCSPLETAAMTLIAALVTIVPAITWHHPMLYLVLPVLVWAALRGGVRAVSVAGVGVAFAADWAAVTGRASELVPGGSASEHLAYIQLFLAVTLIVPLMLAVEVADRRRAEHAGRRAEAERARAELMATAAAGMERRRIARETHDIVGHALNVMLLQAGAARRVLTSDTDRSRELLESIETVGRDAFRDLDVALGFTGEPPELLAGRGLSNVPGLVALMRQAGMTVDLAIDGERNGHVSTLVDWSAFRIIQEAMTNVAKYAPRARTQVGIRFRPDAVLVSVVDDGNGNGNGNGNGAGRRQFKEGRGLIGMRERVSALGGDIEIGPNGGPGFAVRARLPLPATS